jgi:hypothetical protein
LSPEQENAIDLLILGKPDREVAEAVSISCETIWHWHHEHPVFLAELNRQRQTLWAEAHELVRALAGKAVAARGLDRCRQGHHRFCPRQIGLTCQHLGT